MHFQQDWKIAPRDQPLLMNAPAFLDSVTAIPSRSTSTRQSPSHNTPCEATYVRLKADLTGMSKELKEYTTKLQDEHSMSSSLPIP